MLVERPWAHRPRIHPEFKKPEGRSQIRARTAFRQSMSPRAISAPPLAGDLTGSNSVARNCRKRVCAHFQVRAIGAVECVGSVLIALTRMKKIVRGMMAGRWSGLFCAGWFFRVLFGATGVSTWWVVREAKSPKLPCLESLQETLPREVRSSRPESP